MAATFGTPDHFFLLICNLKDFDDIIGYYVMIIALVFWWILNNLFFPQRTKDLYSDVTDDVLDNIVAEIQRHYPNAAYRIIHGLLRAQGLHIQSKKNVMIFRVYTFCKLEKTVALQIDKKSFIFRCIELREYLKKPARRLLVAHCIQYKLKKSSNFLFYK